MNSDILPVEDAFPFESVCAEKERAEFPMVSWKTQNVCWAGAEQAALIDLRYFAVSCNDEQNGKMLRIKFSGLFMRTGAVRLPRQHAGLGSGIAHGRKARYPILSAEAAEAAHFYGEPGSTVHEFFSVFSYTHTFQHFFVTIA